MPWPTGQKHHKAKLTDEDVKQIRELRQKRGASYRVIGMRFRASMWTIRDICEYRTRYAR